MSPALLNLVFQIHINIHLAIIIVYQTTGEIGTLSDNID